uniref:Serpin domain-containing protein n=1 Tax=Strigamia maritima TaxID=126957 RepID=T1IPU0_STRMM
MALAGARENTAKQMKDALKLGASFNTDLEIHEAFQEVINSLLGSQSSAIKLHIANRMYVHHAANILTDYNGTLEKHYNTSSNVVNFEADSEKIRLEINNWVEDQTQTKIKDLIAPGILNELTRLVLVNAIYFKGNWHEQFDPKRTNADYFFLDANKKIMTDLMHLKSEFKFAEDDNLNCKIIELPYVDEAFNLNNLMSRMRKTKVILTLPKFKIEASLSLKDILSAMGMTDLFSARNADLSGITGQKDLFVSIVLHKAFLEVNEEGSEAAAATAIIIRRTAMRGTFDPEFRADHPFLVFIRDNRTNFSKMASKPQNKPEKTNEQKLAQAEIEFTLNLYKQCAAVSTSTENIFISPFSISLALCMTLAGARENTAKQMKDVLKLGASFNTDLEIHEAFQEIINSLLELQSSAIKLHIANRMYVHNKTNILHHFKSVLERYYSASSSEVNFEIEAEKATLDINQWVGEQTRRKIKNLIPPGALTACTRLVLVNAIYFKGNWCKPFDSEKTIAEHFFLDENRAIITNLMHETSDFNYIKDEDTLECQVLELPYADEALSMFVILPTEVDGLDRLEKSLTVSKLNELINGMRKQKVDVTLPKFKIESALSLEEFLSVLGMDDLFCPGIADLSGINDQKLYVSAIFHSAVLEVNEEGSEAAAATAILFVEYCMPFTVEFRANHPFLVCIRDNRSGCILFLGRMVNPDLNAAQQEMKYVPPMDKFGWLENSKSTKRHSFSQSPDDPQNP